MVKKKKLAKTRLDKYYWQAKQQGYRSRAIYKLIQIEQKHELLNSARCIIDLCAAPGGWLQGCKKLAPLDAKIIGVDIVPIPNIPGVTTFQSDIKSSQCKAQLNRILNGQKADVVLNDGAPSVSGNWDKDSYDQVELSLYALRLACNFLNKGGSFITKVFRSKDYTAFLGSCQHFFDKVISTKPHSSRDTSAEIYVICKNFRGPKDLKSGMLDPKIVFKCDETSNKTKNVFKSDKRNRSGYEKDLLTIKTANLMEFVKCKKPAEFLADLNRIAIDDDSVKALSGLAIEEEIKFLCEDLLLLSKTDFKRLLKFRRKALMLLKKSLKETKKEDKPKLEDDKDKTINLLEKKKKETRRRKHKEKMKSLKRLRDKASTNNFALSSDEELFSTKKKTRGAVDNEENEIEQNSENSEFEKESYLVEQEEYFDRMYQEYKEKNDKIMDKEKAENIGENEIGEKFDIFEKGILSDFRKKMILDESKDESKMNELDFKKSYKKQKAENNKKKIDKRMSGRKAEKTNMIEKEEKSMFEIVPESSSENSCDSEAIAETLAIGKAMLNKKRRRDMIDDTYRRNVFNDHDILPEWFVEDEKKNFQPNKPVTAKEIAEFRRDNTRKGAMEKKEIEAIARKKQRKRKRYERIKPRINSVMAGDMSEKQKTIAVEKLKKSYYKRKRP
ncbi:AdoMet-dependent rRNA methyltransferase spb1, partial [Bonamia ostreae]